MKKLAMLVAAVCTCSVAGNGTVDGGQPLILLVSPTMSRAPAFVSVRAVVEASDDNRSLQIVAQSPDYVRSSSIALDGRNAPRLAVFEYPNLPPGLYEVTGVLVGTGGKRATVLRFVNVVSTAGSKE